MPTLDQRHCTPTDLVLVTTTGHPNVTAGILLLHEHHFHHRMSIVVKIYFNTGIDTTPRCKSKI
jgi:hypothetical protein